MRDLPGRVVRRAEGQGTVPEVHVQRERGRQQRDELQHDHRRVPQVRPQHHGLPLRQLPGGLLGKTRHQ